MIYDLLRPAEKGSIRVGKGKGPEAGDFFHELKRVFGMKLLVDDAGGHHVVEPRQRAGHGEQLHGNDGHGVISLRNMVGNGQPPRRRGRVRSQGTPYFTDSISPIRAWSSISFRFR